MTVDDPPGKIQKQRGLALRKQRGLKSRGPGVRSNEEMQGGIERYLRSCRRFGVAFRARKRVASAVVVQVGAEGGGGGGGGGGRC